MRQIKFRAYDKERKKIFFVTGVYGYSDNATEGGEVFLDNEKTSKYFPEDVELMQFTGLKDKNGKEIYEGDVLRAKLTDLDKGRNVSVIYEAPYFDCEDAKGNRIWNLYLVASHQEVIGNVWENPDLVDKQS